MKEYCKTNNMFSTFASLSIRNVEIFSYTSDQSMNKTNNSKSFVWKRAIEEYAIYVMSFY